MDSRFVLIVFGFTNVGPHARNVRYPYVLDKNQLLEFFRCLKKSTVS